MTTGIAHDTAKVAAEDIEGETMRAAVTPELESTTATDSTLTSIVEANKKEEVEEDDGALGEMAEAKQSKQPKWDVEAAKARVKGDVHEMVRK